MKKVLKIIGISTLCLIFIWSIYVTIDCFRLRNAESPIKPFITINMAEYEKGNKYTGLGYSVKYYRETQKIVNDGIDVIAESGYGAEFRLFDKILIWSWKE